MSRHTITRRRQLTGQCVRPNVAGRAAAMAHVITWRPSWSQPDGHCVAVLSELACPCNGLVAAHGVC